MRVTTVGIWVLLGRFVALGQICAISMRGDGHCDPVCMSPLFNFDGLTGKSDCEDLCPPSCTAAMLGNSQCDAECDQWRCSWDSSSCPQCSQDCALEMLGNGNCDASCNTEACNWDAGECVSEIRPAEYYVGEGDSVYEVLAGMWTLWSRVWLLGSVVSLSSPANFPILNVQSSLTISTLLCSLSPHPLCQSFPATLLLSARHPLFSVSGTLVLRDLAISGYFSLLEDDSGLTYCPYRALKDGIWRNDRGEEVQEADNTHACREYWDYSFISISETGSLTLENVQLTGLKQQLKSIIENHCGKITLQNVDFTDCMSSPNDLKGGIIVQSAVPEALQPYWCGELLYQSGAVELLNNGYEYRSDLSLSGFLSGTGFKSVIIENVRFEYNFVPTATSSLLYLNTTRSLLLSNSQFQYNIGGFSAGLYISSDLTYPQSTAEESMQHITIQSVLFANNTSQGCTCVCVTFLNQQQNVYIEDVRLEDNYSPEGYLVSFSSDFLTSIDSIGGYRSPLAPFSPAKSITLNFLHFSTNHGFGVLSITNLANILIQNSTILSQSISKPNFPSVPAAFISHPQAYMSIEAMYEQDSACQCVARVDTANDVRVTGLEVGLSRCKEGVSGVELMGRIGKVRTR